MGGSFTTLNGIFRGRPQCYGIFLDYSYYNAAIVSANDAGSRLSARSIIIPRPHLLRIVQ